MLTNKISYREIWNKLAPPGKNSYLGWRLASIVLAGVILMSGILTAGFVYQNIYSTISNAYSIFALSSELGMDIVDMDTYQKTVNIIAAKNNPTIIPTNLRNIFEYKITPSTSTPSDTKTK